MSRYHLRRLWGSAVPILSTNLLDSGVVDASFNDVLTEAAVAAFNDFTKTSSSAPSANQEDGTPGSRRRRRIRTSTLKNSDTLSSDHASSPPNNDNGARVTPNDNFFEFQRTRGYRLATHYISNCADVRQLEEEHIFDAVVHYLLQVAKIHASNKHSGDMPKYIAGTLQTSGLGSLSIDMWAAVQRGKGAYHAYHVHDDAIVSGVYYSSCPSNCAPLVLRRPAGEGITDANTNDEKNCQAERYKYSLKKDDVVMHPKEGELVLFPPWVRHGVPLITDDEISSIQLPRISWAFNLTGRLASIGDPWSVTRPSNNLQ